MPRASSAPSLDLLIRGGLTFDPTSGRWARLDVGVRGTHIELVEEGIDDAASAVVVDVGGSLVVPGLVDLHVHAYPGATHWGLDADAASLPHGVVAYVDAGSAGAYTFAGLADRLRSSRLDARAFLNIAGGGLAMPHGELLAPEAVDVEAAIRVARAYPDLVVGFKLRASPNTVGENAAACLRAVRRAADELDLRVMVHVSEAPPSLDVVLDHLREGDLLTHCFTPYDNGVVDRDGRPRTEVLAALDRGVGLDLGHGSGSFSFPKAEAWAANDLPPPIVSTDLHAASVLGPAFDACTVASKMLAAGFDLESVLRAATSVPGAWLGRESRLAPGAPADLAVVALDETPWIAWDSRGVEREGAKRLRNRMTVRGGDVLFVAPDLRMRALKRPGERPPSRG